MAVWYQRLLALPWFWLFFAALITAAAVCVLVFPLEQWAVIFAVAAFVSFIYRNTLSPKKNPGVASGFDPTKPGVTVKDIIRAYHVDPPKAPQPIIFQGSWGILNGLAIFGVGFLVVGYSSMLPAPAVFGLSFLTVAGLYWFLKGGRAYIARRQQLANPAPIAAKLHPTPTDTQAAVNQIRLAYSILQTEAATGDEDRPEKLAARLAPASIALNKARALDATATVSFTEKHGTVRYNVDTLAARLLYCEAELYDQMIRKVAAHRLPDDFFEGNEDPVGSVKRYQRDLARILKNYIPAALAAAEKAVLYDPDEPQFLRMLAICYRHSKLNEPADAILQHALKLDPNDIETLRLMQ